MRGERCAGLSLMLLAALLLGAGAAAAVDAPAPVAPGLPATIPLMLVIGTEDISFGIAESTIYKPAAKHPYSKYLAISGGDHRNTDHAASQRIVDLIKGLP